jgi:WD40 repeat protein
MTLAFVGLLAVLPRLPAEGLKERATLKVQSERIDWLAFGPDGRLLSVGGAGYASIWDVTTGTKRATLESQKNGVSCAAFSPDGKTVATGGFDHTVLLWDVNTGKSRLTLSWGGLWVQRVGFNADGKKLAAADEREVRLWDAETGAELNSLRCLVPMRSPVFSPDLSVLAAPDYEDVDLWEVLTGKQPLSLLDHGGQVERLAFRADGKMLAVVSSRMQEPQRYFQGGQYISELRLWALPAGKALLTLHSRPGFIGDIGLSPDGKVLALVAEKEFGAAGELELLNASSGRLVDKVAFTRYKNTALHLAFSSDGKVLAAGCADGSIRLWDLTPAPEK